MGFFQLFIRICTINMSTTVEKSAKPKKATKTTTKKGDTASAHPPSSTMVVKAIEDLKEKKGSSLAAIKKYIGANYKVDLNQKCFHPQSFEVRNREENAC